MLSHLTKQDRAFFNGPIRLPDFGHVSKNSHTPKTSSRRGPCNVKIIARSQSERGRQGERESGPLARTALLPLTVCVAVSSILARRFLKEMCFYRDKSKASRGKDIIDEKKRPPRHMTHR